jgi:lysozyme family protein
MRSNWDKAFRQVIVYEGGYVNHPKDPGGPTNLGITQATLSRYLGRNATIKDVRALTRAAVQPIYKRFFWDVLRCDDLPGGVDLAVYDFGVNSGTSRAARYLQSVVGVTQDGQIGPATIAACNKYSAEEIVKRLVAKRRGFLMGLKTWRTFGKGWNRRLVSVQTVALAMAPPKTGVAFAGLASDIPPDGPVADVVEVSTQERESNQVTGDEQAIGLQEAEQNDGIGGLWGVKPFLASKTLWANLLGFLSVMPIIGGYLSGENLSQWAEAISAFIAAAAFIASSVARISAKYQLKAGASTKLLSRA